MRKIIINNTKKALVHCIIGVKAGWRHEYDGMRGISHFIEHAIFLGNKNHPLPDNETFEYGLYVDGKTLPEYILFQFTSMKEDFDSVYRILYDLITNPSFDSKKIRVEKENNILPCVIRESDFSNYELSIEWIKNLIFEWDCFKSLGTINDIEKLNVNDLKKWHNNYFKSENMFTIFYGDSEYSKILKSIDSDKFSNSSSNNIVRHYWHSKERIIEKVDCFNSEIALGYTIKKYQPSIDVLKILLGNNALSKLWSSNFKKYAFTSMTRINWTSTGGAFIIEFGLNKSNQHKALYDQLRNLFDNFTITEKELNSAVKIQKINILKSAEKGEQGLFELLNNYPLDSYNNFNEIIESYREIKKDDIYNLINEIFNTKNEYRVIVGKT